MRDDHHPRRRVPGPVRGLAAWCLDAWWPLGVEGAQARDEAGGIPAPVGVMVPDELPAPPRGLGGPVLLARPVLAAGAAHAPPLPTGTRE